MANYKIVQSINILNQSYSSVAAVVTDTVEIAFLDSTKYNGAAFYLEVIAKNTDADTNEQISLRGDPASSFDERSVQIDMNTTSWTRFRSAAFTPDDGAEDSKKFFRLSQSDSDGTLQIKTGRIVVLQDAATITDTQTQIEIGAYQTKAGPGAADTYEKLDEHKIWKYESAAWDPTPTFTLGFTASNENDMDIITVALQEASDAAFTANVATVASSPEPFTSEAVGYYESSAFTLTPGYYHRLIWQSNDSMTGCDIFNAKIIATQTGTITKLQPEVCQINKMVNTTNNKEDYSYYDPAEWNVEGGSLTWDHEHTATNANDNTRLEYDN
jgi:hypothetical protein